MANCAGEGEGYERKVLPEELSRSVMKLTCESSTDAGICDVYVVGTAHVSAVNSLLFFNRFIRNNARIEKIE